MFGGSSKSQGTGGRSGGFSQLKIVDQTRAEKGLRDVFEGKADWAIMSYVQGGTDEAQLVRTGSGGVAALRREFPSDRVYFVLLTLHYVSNSSRDTITKFILVTLIGPEVKPLQKARSSGQRDEISQFVKSVVPLHAHFQPSNPDELTEEAILEKFHD